MILFIFLILFKFKILDAMNLLSLVFLVIPHEINEVIIHPTVVPAVKISSTGDPTVT